MASVLDPDGAKWTVRRRWLPWRPRRKMPDDWDLGDASFDGDDIFSIVMNVLLLVLLIPVLILALLVAAEFLLLLILLPLWVLARSLFGTPWIIVVRRDRKIVAEEAVRGWGASGARIDQLKAVIAAGEAPRQSASHP
ncbi:hypothetical protein [Mycolicibacterium mageritense]|uniref:Uncharacterized protein n=1 Tax=Mycolicibacterium mageritense TaxID=53462 RepID=A0AAI8XQY6_MYCME|nr:hypothetical protein [Mycolicibacterium mageritense]TXI58036.1 MAG: hypothetical protein E6Q55_24660 [Mycolicibacterium mageritense]BDY31497.1 hypothetical protein hbim_05453 [Mycolicibacterium mageritense]